MIKSARLPHLLAAIALLSPCILPAQQAAPDQDAATGIFQGSTDIGTTNKGNTVYNPANDAYILTGSGSDLWGTADQFHFAWVRLTGDVTLTADISFPNASKEPLRKAVLMVRQSLDPGSPYADIAIHGDGHITLQYRKEADGITADTTSTQRGSIRLRIERKGNQYTVSAGTPGKLVPVTPLTANVKNSEYAGKLGELVPMAPITINLNDPVYVGIGICPHNANGYEQAIFSHVKIERHAAEK